VCNPNTLINCKDITIWSSSQPHYRQLKSCGKLLYVDNCVLLGYYAASSGNIVQTFRDYLWVWKLVPKRRQEITINSCVITQKSAVLIYFAAEAWNPLAETDDKRVTMNYAMLCPLAQSSLESWTALPWRKGH